MQRSATKSFGFLLLTVLSIPLNSPQAFGQNPFQSQIRPTEPLTAEQQLQAFSVPEGFRVQLFASEPDLQKPLNMAFDAHGRMWVTGSVEYPFAAESGQGRDTVRVLEDTDRDGTADRVTVFAEGLNIPIGLYPYRNGVVVYSIPEILYLEDTDGDLRADRRTVLYGPLGTPRDTHGMQNAFRRGFDGWLYICHGFSNETVIRGRDGSEVSLQSGNTYRVRLDGSRVEQFTWGQVNPFGSTWTPWGDLITADCHSKPLTLLVREGYYSSFGKPHDGLGFVPPIMEHGHGSTAISGVAYCSSPSFPPEYQGHLFVGNVMTSRVNHDSLKQTGSSFRAIEEPDFLTTTDPWFRPVDLQFGPDGALYVADFYNRIIGHYEVPLTHAGRDRARGRIWRISWDSPPRTSPQQQTHQDLAAADIATLLDAFQHPHLTVRQLATDQLTDRIGAAAVPQLLRLLAAEDTPAIAAVHGLWALFRIDPTQVNPPLLRRLVGHPSATLRTHVMRVLEESTHWSPEHTKLAVAALDDPDDLVRRAAAGALSQHPAADAVQPLLLASLNTPKPDFLLQHTLRIALRNQLRTSGQLARLAPQLDTPASQKLITEVCLGLPTAESAAFLMQRLQDRQLQRERLAETMRLIVAHLPPEQLATALNQLQATASDNEALQLELLETLQTSLQQNNLAPPKPLVVWAQTLAEQLLQDPIPASARWMSLGNENPWGLERRNCEDGQQNVLFLSSLPGGEARTGRLRSPTFVLPDSLSFDLCGHLGFPQNEALPDNFVRLCLAESGETLATVHPPRSDTARRVNWSLKEHAGQRVYVEVVDGIALNAYAWLAVSRFDPPVLEIPQFGPREIATRLTSACQLIGRYRLESLEHAVAELLTAGEADRQVTIAACRASHQLEGTAITAALLEPLEDPSTTIETVRQVAQAIATREEQELPNRLAASIRVAPAATQQRMAAALAADRQGARQLLKLVRSGAASPRLLQDPNTRQALEKSLPIAARKTIEELTAGLPTVSQRVANLIQDAQRQYRRQPPDASRGRSVFRKHCSVCHQIAGQGGLIGPQLDGVGGRGVPRILEDVLDPNRNIDKAFRTTVLAMQDGRVLLGLQRRRENENLILANAEGKEFSVRESDIEERSIVQTSIMPGNWGETIPTDDLLALTAYLAEQTPAPPTPVAWQYQQIDPTFRGEGVAVGDVNRDGHLDVLTGEFWYEAPEWKRHEITQPGEYGDGARGYSQSFACFCDDIDQDGWQDYLVIGFPGAPCHWYRNPQHRDGHWERFEIWHSACNETPLYTDLFGTGRRVLVMGWQPEGQQNQGQMAWFAPGENPRRRWVMHPISRPSTSDRVVPGTHRFAHGLGTGDVDGDGRSDVLCPNGWWQQPADPDSSKPWRFHSARLGPACANMHVVDLNADAISDVISSSAHGFGIWWHEGKVTGEARNFQRQELFSDLVSQTHALNLTDINQDGLPDLVTGKRWWAHGPSGDPGSDQPAMLYWFEGYHDAAGRLAFYPRPIHAASGIGTQFAVDDINGDGLPDVISSNKRGVHVLLQQRRPAEAKPVAAKPVAAKPVGSQPVP